MSQVPAMPRNVSSGGQRVVTAVRREFGMHVYFNEPFNADQKDFRVEFSRKFVKNSKLTIVVEVLANRYMEICYETLENSDKYFYLSRDPIDAKLYAGTKLLHLTHHHRQDLPLSNNTFDSGKPLVFQLEWRSDDKIEFYVEGKASITGTKPSATSLKDCARLVAGEQFVGDTSKDLRGFKVYEVHHTSTRWQTLFEEDPSVL
ncbi:uncharacterized protein LOC119457966 isoform X2 [Dermacentor silvarum]|uniref:uncharacterized protein LOC119457966 isoform X2 n=1 Tax=Dermacentor silvarum TaxID=543639 RepID=UPI0021016794|nr:uncharacterized protein LOC119457966 isoform X2 [Dermacentor silvarum]